MAEQVVPAAVPQSRVQISGQSVVPAEPVELRQAATAATAEQAALGRRPEPVPLLPTVVTAVPVE